jgi:hypothetical protein
MYYIERDLGELSELLKTSKLDPSFDKNSPIWWAARRSSIEIVTMLLKDERVISKLDEWEISEIIKLTYETY